MPFVSVTRLRLRSWRFLPLFVPHALWTQRQVERAEGFRAGSLLPGQGWTFWTLTSWDSAEAMRAYMLNGAHRKAMPKLAAWCDEASVVHWETDEDGLPDWPQAEARMRVAGRPSKVRHPSLEHQTMTFAPPRSFTGRPLRVRQREI